MPGPVAVNEVLTYTITATRAASGPAQPDFLNLDLGGKIWWPSRLAKTDVAEDGTKDAEPVAAG